MGNYLIKKTCKLVVYRKLQNDQNAVNILQCGSHWSATMGYGTNIRLQNREIKPSALVEILSWLLDIRSRSWFTMKGANQEGRNAGKEEEKSNLLAISADSSLPTTIEIIGLRMLRLVKELKSWTRRQISLLRHFSFLATMREAAKFLVSRYGNDINITGNSKRWNAWFFAKAQENMEVNALYFLFATWWHICIITSAKKDGTIYIAFAFEILPMDMMW